jgi:hypothetical protein
MSRVEDFELELEKQAADEIFAILGHNSWFVHEDQDGIWGFFLNGVEKTTSYSRLNVMKSAVIMLRNKPEISLDKNYEIVDHPKHYGGAEAKHEAISVIEEWRLCFHLGNVVKYISRAGKKPDQDTISDLKKARWYLDRYISNLEANNVADSEE